MQNTMTLGIRMHEERLIHKSPFVSDVDWKWLVSDA